MRVRVLILVCVLGGLFGVERSADAQKVKTNQSTKVYSRAGESGKVILRVREGQGMKILAREGRWLKVNVQGRTGYVPRSKVDLPDSEDDIQRNTRRRPFVDGRSTKRGFGGEGPDDRVGADATETDGGGDDKDDKDHGGKGAKHHKGKGDDDDDDQGSHGRKGKSEDDEPEDKGEDKDADDERVIAHVGESSTVYAEASRDSDKAFKASHRDTLYVSETKGKWTLVENDDGDTGWIQTSKLDIEGGGGAHGVAIDLRARGGVSIISQGVRTVGGGTGVPDNYNIGTSSFTIALGGSYLRPYGKDYVVGGEATYNLSLAVPGINYTDPTTKVTQNTGFKIHDLNLRAEAGYDLHNPRGMVVFGRLGYHYENFAIDDVKDLTKNNAKLPSEIFSGPTLGVALVVPKMTEMIGLRATLDALLIGGSRVQTQNLEDGASPKSMAVWLGAALSYKWKPDMNLEGIYNLSYASTDFGAPVATSQRMHTGSAVSRTDVYHSVTFGICKAF